MESRGKDSASIILFSYWLLLLGAWGGIHEERRGVSDRIVNQTFIFGHLLVGLIYNTEIVLPLNAFDIKGNCTFIPRC